MIDMSFQLDSANKYEAVVFAIVSGLGVSIVGYSSQFVIPGSMIMPVCVILLLTFKVETPTSMWYVTPD